VGGLGGSRRRLRQHPPPALLDHWALFKLVRGRVWATVENRRRVAGYLSMYDDKATGWIAGRRALKSIGTWCRGRGIPFVVVIFPLFGNPLDDRYPFSEIHQKVRQAAEEAGAKVIDLLPAYRGLLSGTAAPRPAVAKAAPAQVTVTLVRWPYT
jgi:hypothetical protein